MWPSQVANIFTLCDVSNIWRVPLLLRVNREYRPSFLIHQTKFCTLALCWISYSCHFRTKRHMKLFLKFWILEGNIFNVPYKSKLKVSRCYMQSQLLISHICSVAGEPNLEEWTARADLYDTLQETVSLFFHPHNANKRDIWDYIKKGKKTIMIFFLTFFGKERQEECLLFLTTQMCHVISVSRF